MVKLTFGQRLKKRALEAIASVLNQIYGNPLLRGYRKDPIKDGMGYIISSENPLVGLAAERTNATFAAVVARISDAIKTLPMHVQERTINAKGNEAWLVDDASVMTEILRFPNTEMPLFTESEWKTHDVQSLLAAGNSYCYAEPDGGRFNIWPLDPAKMKIGCTEGFQKKIVKYAYNYYGNEYHIFKPSEIIHIRMYNVGAAGCEGLSRNQGIETELRLDQAVDNNSITWFENNGMPAAFVMLDDQMFGDENFQKVKEQYLTGHQGIGKNNKIAWLPFKGTVTETQKTPADLGFTETKRVNKENIAGLHGVPPILIGILQGVNFATAGIQETMFWTLAVIPMCHTIAEARTVFFFASRGDMDSRMAFDMTNVKALKPNEFEEAKKDALFVSAGMITVNEWREKNDMEPVEWGDEPPANPLQLPADQPPDNSGDNVDSQKKMRFIRATSKDPRRQIRRKYDRQRRGWELAMQRDLVRFYAGQKRRVLDEVDKLTLGGSVGLWLATRDKASDDGNQIFNSRDESKKMVDATKNTREKKVREAGQMALNELKLAASFNMSSEAIANSFQTYVSRMQAINDATGEDLTQLIRKGYLDGKTIPEIKKDIRDLYDEYAKYRVDRIARTEIGTATNTGIVDGYRQGGVRRLEWVATMDDKTRDTHAELDGETIELGGAFLTSAGNMLQYPSDPNGAPEETINCRCRVIAVPDEQGEF